MADVSAGRRILIKFGGNALSGEGDLGRFAEDIASLISSGIRPVLVHGGGPEISQEMERRGLRVKKVSGLRVTDDAALQVAAEVLERINGQIVEALARAGVTAQGMSGCEGGTVIADRMAPVRTVDDHGNEVLVDLDRVGEVSGVNGGHLESLISSGTVPVIYPICADRQGREYNVNADTVAAHVGRAVGAKEMALVTDVPGILKSGSVIRSASLADIDRLIADGTITGGMVPKVEACRTALLNGAEIVYMLNGKEQHSLVRKLLKGENIGTRITAV